MKYGYDKYLCHHGLADHDDASWAFGFESENQE